MKTNKIIKKITAIVLIIAMVLTNMNIDFISYLIKDDIGKTTTEVSATLKKNRYIEQSMIQWNQ